jgi:hypothetical protein
VKDLTFRDQLGLGAWRICRQGNAASMKRLKEDLPGVNSFQPKAQNFVPLSRPL